MASLIAGVIVSIVVFALGLYLVITHHRRIDREYRAAQVEKKNQLINRLMATSLESRMAVTFVALAMVNAGPCHLMHDKMRDRILWIDHFLANFCQAVESINDLSLAQIYTGPFEGKDNVLDTLANDQKFMYFILRSYAMIDTFLGHYWTSLDEIYPGEIRDAVRVDMVNAEAFVKAELKRLYEEFGSLASA